MSDSATTKCQTPRDLPQHAIISWGQAARQLGVSKSHLWRVVNGERNNAELLAAYTRLLKPHAAGVVPQLTPEAI